MWYKIADDFHYNELQLKHEELKRDKKRFSWVGLYKKTSDFGTSWIKPILIILIIAALFSVFSFSISIFENDIYSIKTFDTNKYVDTIKDDLSSRIGYSVYIHYCNMLFVQDKKIGIDNEWIPILLRIQQILTAPLFLLAGLAIRRKFRM